MRRSFRSKMPSPARSGVWSLLAAALSAVGLGVMGFLYLRHEAAIAERTIREEGERYGMLAAVRLRESFDTFLRSDEIAQRAVTSASIFPSAMFRPTSSKDDIQAYRAFLEVESDPDELGTLIPTLGSRTTPAGLSLRAVALLQLARLHQEEGNPERAYSKLQDLLPEVVERNPSVVSESFLEVAEQMGEELNFSDLLEVNSWRAKLIAQQETRDLLRRNHEQILRQSNISRWFDDRGTRYLQVIRPDDQELRFAVSEQELEDLTGEALADLWPLAENGPRSLSLRIVIDRQQIYPTPYNDWTIRQDLFEEKGFDAVSSRGWELASQGIGVLRRDGIYVYAASRSQFDRHVRQRMLWQGAFLAAAILCLFIGFWKTWRTLAMQRQLNLRQSNLISSVSHELRSPVAGIRLLAERLAREESGTQSEKADPGARGRRDGYLRLVAKESDRLARLIDNILDTGRISEGRMEYEPEWIDLAALLRDTAERYAVLAEEEGKGLDCRIDPDVSIDLLADPVALQQAVGNLLDNALKFSAEGGEVELDLRIHPDCKEVEILVGDQGCGIAPEEIPRIFDLFYRSGSELRREHPGTGLGLFLVKSIAEAHHGRIEVQSEAGQGSKFTLILPFFPESTDDF